jgi:hypothetical protein
LGGFSIVEVVPMGIRIITLYQNLKEVAFKETTGSYLVVLAS